MVAAARDRLDGPPVPPEARLLRRPRRHPWLRHDNRRVLGRRGARRRTGILGCRRNAGGPTPPAVEPVRRGLSAFAAAGSGRPQPLRPSRAPTTPEPPPGGGPQR